MKIDELDRQILNLLQNDASLTIKELAYELKKSIATVHDRIGRLKQNGVITKNVILLDRKKVGKGLLAFSHVLLKEHSLEAFETFEAAITSFPEVLECFQMTGSYDFLLRIATNDMEEYHNFYRLKLATLPNISTVQSYFALSETKSITSYHL